MEPVTATIDYLFLARHAEAANGLLNVIGGGCTELRRRIPPDGSIPITHFGIAVSLCIPWSETNKQHRFYVRVIRVTTDKEAATIVRTGTHLFTLNRPSYLEPGEDQRVVLGIEAEVLFPAEGKYRLVADLNDG